MTKYEYEKRFLYLKSDSAKRKKHKTKYEYEAPRLNMNTKKVCVPKIGFRENQRFFKKPLAKDRSAGRSPKTTGHFFLISLLSFYLQKVIFRVSWAMVPLWGEIRLIKHRIKKFSWGRRPTRPQDCYSYIIFSWRCRKFINRVLGGENWLFAD